MKTKKQAVNKKDMRSKPRFLQHLKAKLLGYFWLPCTLCGEYFGGHEEYGYLQTSYEGGEAVCINCVDHAHELNKQSMKKLYEKQNT